MGTQIQPDQNNNPDLENPQNSNTENPPSSDSNLSVDTTESAKAQQALFFEALREKEQQIRALREQVEASRNATPRDEGDPWNKFTENPKDVISREVAAQVAPINNFIQQLQRNEAITKIKSMLRNASPQYKEVLDKAEVYVDQVIGNAEVNVQNVQAAINMVAGLIATGQIQGVSLSVNGVVNNPNPAPPINKQQNKEIPVSMPPSSNPISRPNTPQNAEPWKNLTEAERKFARMNGMTDKEYWERLQEDILVVPNQKPVSK